MVLTHYMKKVIALYTKQTICPTSRHRVKKYIFYCCLCLSIEYLLHSLIFMRMRDAGWYDTAKHIVTYTLKLCKPMELLLVKVCGWGLRPFLVFHCFFSSCIWKKPFCVTKERGCQLPWWNTTPYRKSLYWGVAA